MNRNDKKFDIWQDYDYQNFVISPDQTHHFKKNNTPAYSYRFHNVLSFHPPGVAAVIDESGAYHITPDGKPLYSQRFDRTFGYYFNLAAVVLKGNWFHIDLNGERIYKENFKWIGNFQEGLCPVLDLNDKCYHIDLSGKRIYPENYAYVGDFKYGIAVVRSADGFAFHIDKQGKMIHQSKFLDLDNYHKGFARARDNWGWCHIDLQGNPIYSERYRMVEPFYNGFARVITFDNISGIIDESGKWIRNLETHNVCEQKLSSNLQNLFVNYWKPQTIVAAIKLGILEELNRNPCDIKGLAKKISIMEDHCSKLMNGLIVLGLVKGDNSGYELTPKGQLLTQDHPNSLYYSCLVFGEEHYQAWNYLAPFMQEFAADSKYRSAFERTFGLDFFSYLDQNPEKAKIYHKALSFFAEKDYNSIFSEFEIGPLMNSKSEGVSNRKVVIDIGGGKGIVLKKVLSKYPNAYGVLFEMEQASKMAAIFLRNFIEKKRVQVISGDFFKDISLKLKEVSFEDGSSPMKFDAIFLCRVLHDWDDNRAGIILQNCAQILKDAGRIYIIEMVIPENPIRDIGVFLSLNLIAVTGGKERNLREFKQILSESGLILEKHQRFGLMNVMTVKIGEKRRI